jgi:hypothetical protein
MTEQEARQKPSDVQRHIIRFDYPSFQLERAAQGSELARQFLRRITHQRMTIDAFLDGAPSLEKALDKLFLKFGEDEEEDAALLKVARLYLRERAAQREVDAATTQEQEPETESTPEEQLRNFDEQYAEWVNQANALQAELAALEAELAALGNRIRLEGITPETNAQLSALRQRIREVGAQLDEINHHLENAVEEYIDLMETVFGYNLEIDPNFQGTRDERIAMITTLRDANFLIVDYLDDILEGTEMTGLEAFQLYFAQMPTGEITVHLGADDDALGTYTGRTPFAPNLPEEEHRQIYLGSGVSEATIVHEFFHQLDRYFGTLLSPERGVALSTNDPNVGLITYLSTIPTSLGSTGLTLTNELIAEGSGANYLPNDAEIFANLGMTAVLDNLGYTVDPFGGSSEVAFADTFNARDFECAFQQYLRQVLTEGRATTFDPSECQS